MSLSPASKLHVFSLPLGWTTLPRKTRSLSLLPYENPPARRRLGGWSSHPP